MSDRKAAPTNDGHLGYSDTFNLATSYGTYVKGARETPDRQGFPGRI